MIPYDDLVVALANWRSKQGLGAPAPMAPAPSAPVPVAAPAATAKSGSGPKTAAPGSGPNKPAPKPAAPAPVVMSEPVHEVEETLLESDEDLDSTFDSLQGHTDEATSIGSAPAPSSRDSFGGETSPEPLNPKGSIRSAGNRNDDW